MVRGALIVLEGCDRVGKSTHVKKLAEKLLEEKIPSEILAFPNRSTLIGQVLNKYLTQKDEKIPDKAVHLLFSANRWEQEPRIKDKLSNGITLIVDRYSYSGVAFSTAKGNIDAKWCWQSEMGLPKPDLVLLLTTPLGKAAARLNYGDERYENQSFQEKVITNFQNMVDSTWQVINTDRDVNTVHEEIKTYTKEVISRVTHEPLLFFS